MTQYELKMPARRGGLSTKALSIPLHWPTLTTVILILTGGVKSRTAGSTFNEQGSYTVAATVMQAGTMCIETLTIHVNAAPGGIRSIPPVVGKYKHQ